MFAVISRSDSVAAAPRLQRSRGEGRVGFVATPRGTMLGSLYEDGSAKIRLPRTRATEAEVILINTAGGLTGGDHLAFSVEMGAGAKAVVTTQACERIYRSLGGAAIVKVAITIGQDGRVDWLPQETILFDRAELSRTMEVTLAAGATFLAVEPIIFGRKAQGETVASGGLRDRWRIRQAGRLIHADDIRMEGDLKRLIHLDAVLAGAGAMASLIYVGADPDRYVEAVRLAFGERGGASAFNGKLVARLVAEDGLSLRRRLVPALAALRGGAALPKSWLL